MDFGHFVRSHDADVVSFDKKGRKRPKKAIGHQAYQRFSSLLDVYAVVSDDGSVITVARSLKRPHLRKH